MVYLFCAYRKWALELYDMISKKHKNFVLLNDPKKLTTKYLQRINPEIIFFPDWSWIIPKEIFTSYKCICFHESNLPKFRGGSPLQNQIIRGIEKTKSTAFIMTEGLDEGNILLQKNLSLKGSLDEIFERMIENDYYMIVRIINGRYKTQKQVGKPTVFKRRKPADSELKHLNYDKKYLYNFIRMLSDPYPNAFLRVGNKKIIFKSAKYDDKKLECVVEIV